ncbi:MAG: flippase-like domain-containing protein [Candidatus Aminicenantes bacterium]|nr:flippase-like domain-containing protein [Candidatus Aminicenantes bacterium]
MRKTWFRLGIIFVLTAVFLFFFFKSVDWNDVLANLTNVNLKYFLLALLIAPLHLLTRAIRWQYLIKYEKRGVSLFNRIAANAVGFTVNFIFPGRLGEIAKPLYLAQKEDIKKGFMIGTVVVERIFDIIICSMLLGLYLVSRPIFPSFYHAGDDAYSLLSFWWIFGISIATFLLFLILAVYFFKEKALSVFAFLLRPFSKKLSEKILNIFDEFIQGLKFFHSVGNLFVYILLSVVVWLGITLFYWVFLLAYNIDVSYVSTFPYVFLTGVGASIPTPGMVGGFHYFSKLGMTSFLNVESNLAVSITIAVHAVQLVVTCLIGYAILWKEGISLLQIKKLGEDSNR